MIKYRAKSWQIQGREMADRQIEYVNAGQQTIQGAIKFFNDSYRNPKIIMTAAKRFGKAVRSGKVKENIEAYKNYMDDFNSFEKLFFV